jgi:hypothetical protein
MNVSAEMNIEWLQGKRREKWHLRSHAVDILTFGLETPFSASKLAKNSTLIAIAEKTWMI